MPKIDKGALQPQTFSFKWEVERFFADCEKVGDSYTSQIYPIECSAKVTKWSLKTYPKGVKPETKDHVGLYLFFQSDDVSEITVDYKLSIASKQKSLYKLIKAETFKSPNDDWGWPQFVKPDVIKDIKNDALINDTLTILCEITFCPAAQDVTEKKDYDDILNKIGKGFEDYEKLLDNNYFSDVTFNIQDKKLYLHKAILMCRNSVFKAMFEHEMKENKESLVDITDIDFPVMKELFRFIYSGKVEDIEKIAKDLLIAADKYCVIELKALCEQTLYHSLKVDNSMKYLKLTEKCDTIQLKKLVINFVVANLKDIVQTSDFNLLFADINREVVIEIMKALAEKN